MVDYNPAPNITPPNIPTAPPYKPGIKSITAPVTVRAAPKNRIGRAHV